MFTTCCITNEAHENSQPPPLQFIVCTVIILSMGPFVHSAFIETVGTNEIKNFFLFFFFLRGTPGLESNTKTVGHNLQ